jgi:hypothetical protein
MRLGGNTMRGKALVLILAARDGGEERGEARRAQNNGAWGGEARRTRDTELQEGLRRGRKVR